MKVVIPVFRLTRAGGIERYMWEVARGLSERGHDVTLVAPQSTTRPPAGVKHLRMHHLPGHSSALVLANLATFGVRVNLRMSRARTGGVVYRSMGAAFGKGVVNALSCHAAWLRDRDEALGMGRVTPLDRALLWHERATYRDSRVTITTVSKLCAQDIAVSYGVAREKIVVIPPAIDRAEFAPRTDSERRKARAAFGFEEGQLVIGTAANFAFARKRVDLLIHVAADLGASLLIAGEPDLRHAAYRALAASRGGDIRFLGPVTDMRSFYAALDVFALPSINEAYGMAAHEAMGVGVATVLSDRCGVSCGMVSGRNAELIPYRHIDELGDRIKRLCNDEYRNALAESGCRWAHRRSWVEVVDELVPVLERAESI